MNTDIETRNLNEIAGKSLYAAGTMRNTIEHCLRIFARYMRGGRILEMGPAEGVMTDQLVKLGGDLTVVEGARTFCDDLRPRHPQLTVVNSLFEDFSPESRFDSIILSHVLEHVEDPTDILRRVGTWLAPGGRILAAVPNSRSLHRQAAVIMGVLSFEESLNEADRHHGHRRVFNPESFRNVFLEVGLTIEVFGGYWLKPISSGQIEASWTEEMLDAFMQLGERYPDIAAEIYVIASKN